MHVDVDAAPQLLVLVLGGDQWGLPAATRFKFIVVREAAAPPAEEKLSFGQLANK